MLTGISPGGLLGGCVVVMGRSDAAIHAEREEMRAESSTPEAPPTRAKTSSFHPSPTPFQSPPKNKKPFAHRPPTRPKTPSLEPYACKRQNHFATSHHRLIPSKARSPR